MCVKFNKTEILCVCLLVVVVVVVVVVGDVVFLIPGSTIQTQLSNFYISERRHRNDVTYQIQDLRQRQPQSDVNRVTGVEDGPDGGLVVPHQHVHQLLLQGEEARLLPVPPVAVVDWWSPVCT